MRMMFCLSVAASLVTLAACGDKSSEALAPSFATGDCILQITSALPTPLSAPAHSTGNQAAWFLKNTGDVSITITGQTGLRTGSVTAVQLHNWTSFPRTLTPGTQIDADAGYSTGNPGTGFVGLTLATSCGSKTAKSFVNVN